MQVHTFLAESVADAVTQIRETLGQEAVVLNVRRLPAEGLARLWQKPRIEVLAHVPEKPAIAPVTTVSTPAAALDEVQVSALAGLRAEMQEMRDSMASATPSSFSKISDRVQTSEAPARSAGDWSVGHILEQSGLLPVHAERVMADLCSAHGDAAPVSIAEEIELAKQMLASRWKTSQSKSVGIHVFIGAPGAGKTTVLCKWLAQIALVEGRSAAVWRLDGHVANTAESISVFGEILGVPVERYAPVNGELPDADVLFVDLPGINPTDAVAMDQLAQRIGTLPHAQVHLVVNAAYETSLMLAQVRAFSKLPITDVIVTHLDEESRWGKVWNVALGTNCPVSLLSTGQNIPGDLSEATPEKIFMRQFPRKHADLTANT